MSSSDMSCPEAYERYLDHHANDVSHGNALVATRAKRVTNSHKAAILPNGANSGFRRNTIHNYCPFYTAPYTA